MQEHTNTNDEEAIEPSCGDYVVSFSDLRSTHLPATRCKWCSGSGCDVSDGMVTDCGGCDGTGYAPNGGRDV